jgi:hypothetical protein
MHIKVVEATDAVFFGKLAADGGKLLAALRTLAASAD